MNSSLHFPDADTMTQYLRNHPLLKGVITKKRDHQSNCAELAAARFSDSDKVEEGVKIGALLLINDLREGKDGFTGEPLPSLRKLRLPFAAWDNILMATEEALLDCAKKV